MPARVASHFPGHGTSVSGARRFVAATLQGWGLDPLLDVACLLVSELVSNVVLHARTDLDVCVLRLDVRVRIEVCDRSPHLPRRQRTSLTSASGRGLHFVEELAQAWGADPKRDGKCVWFELLAEGTAAPVGAASVGRAEPGQR